MSNERKAALSLIFRLELHNNSATFGRVAQIIGEEGGDIIGVDVVHVEKDIAIRDVNINVYDRRHGKVIREHLENTEGIHVINISDRTMLMHLGGKIEIRSKIPVRNRD
ncbi:MAG: NAD-dependent malic enzyme, partial [Tumebacillaceae bacterium]